MRITLTGKIDTTFADRLSKSLGLPVIVPEINTDPMTGLNSDDHCIGQILDDIGSTNRAAGQTAVFLLLNYPRNVIQAQSLDVALSRIGHPVSAALMLESSKNSQNRTTLALIRYYRSQNKLILIDESSNIKDICKIIHTIYCKRRTKKPARNNR